MVPKRQSYIAAIRHIPPGGVLTLSDVPWEEYEQLLSELGDGYGVRVTYNHGRLELMSPLPKHERYKELISDLASVIADERDVELEKLGSTTFKQEAIAEGTEPDTCFYIQNASRIIGKDRIDLNLDPPPDVAVEVDVSHASTSKMDIYARIGVPEIWRYDETRMHIYRLTPQGYVEVESSLAFPFLTSDTLTRFLEDSKTAPQRSVLKRFREWLRSQVSPN